jgi:outer membrane immunogenic protein
LNIYRLAESRSFHVPHRAKDGVTTELAELTGRMTMAKFIRMGIAAMAGAAVTCSAHAADLRPPVYKAPPTPVYSWTGCYIGGQVGAQWARFTGDVVYPGDFMFVHGPVTATRDFNSDGNFLYGGQIGCNWQPWGGGFVVGLEGDVAGINRNTNSDGEIFRFPFPFTMDHFNQVDRLRTQASVRLRGGFTWDRMMIYVAGGVSWANLSVTQSFIRDGDGSLIFDASTTRTGWNIGVGAEYMLYNCWTIGIEYRFTDYGSFDFAIPGGNSGTLTWRPFTASVDNLRTQDVRLRLNYMFNSAPVMARY